MGTRPLHRKAASAALAVMLASCGGGDAGEAANTMLGTQPAPTENGTVSTTAVTEFGSISVATDAEIVALLESGDIPSAAAAIVIGDQIVWAKGYGEQASLDTVYMAGSIDKAFIATAVMQLVDRGLIDLQADVNTYLPFPVRHPDYPETAVTVEQLLLHRSGLVGDLPDSSWYDNDLTALQWAADELGSDISGNPYAEGRPPLGEYLASHFQQSDTIGIWIFEPDSDWKYSNLGAHLLLSHIVERVSGQTLEAYTKDHILAPLGMDDTGFEAVDYDESVLAVPYTRVDGQNKPLPVTGMSSSGRIRTTATDLARFLGAHMGGGNLAGVEILSPESINTMHEVHTPLGGIDSDQLRFRGIGYGWWLWTEGRSGHGGAVPGFLAKMVMQETDAGVVGIVVMINVGCSLHCDETWQGLYWVPLRELLLAEARDMLASP